MASIHNVRVLENIIRFYILSFHEGFQLSGFDSVQNTERLTDNLKDLLTGYQTAQILHRRKHLSDTDYAEIKKNTAEFFAYALIATTGGIEGLRGLINVDWSADYDEDEKALIKEAIGIRQLIMSKNTCKFFRILRKGETNYFFACLMLITMQRMRC